MLIDFLRHFPVSRMLIFYFGKRRAAHLLEPVLPHLKAGQHVLDIGTGMGNITLMLRSAGMEVTGVDVRDLSFTPAVKPIIYDGQRLPFTDHSFDVALILTVLHHTPDPDAIIREAMRVATKVIILEDVYETRTRQYATYIADSVLNLEFFGHPHSNRTDKEWRQSFKRLGLKVSADMRLRSWPVFSHRMYVLSKTK